MKTVLPWIIRLAVLVAVLVGGWLAMGHFLRPDVLVVPASRGTALNAITGSVEVAALEDINVRSEAYGQILEFLVGEGDFVEAGQILCRQESAMAEHKLEQTRVQLRAAEAVNALPLMQQYDIATMEEAVANLKIAVEVGQRPASELERQQRELEKRRNEADRTRIQQERDVAFLRAQEALQQEELDQLTVRAPFAGQVVATFRYQGDLVHGATDLLRLVSVGRRLYMTLSEEEFEGVELDQLVRVRLASRPHDEYSGKVAWISPVANTATKTRRIYVEVAAPVDVLAPGLTGEGYLVKDQRNDAIIIPRRALIGDEVFVLRGNGTVEVRKVQPGFLSLDRAEIREGLSEGDVVIVEGQGGLRTGDRVKPQPVRAEDLR